MIYACKYCIEMFKYWKDKLKIFYEITSQGRYLSFIIVERAYTNYISGKC